MSALIQQIDDAIEQLFSNTLIVTLAFIIFFIPQEYAIGPIPYLIWQICVLLISGFAALGILIQRQYSTRMVAYSAFYCIFYCGSSIVAQSNGSILGMIYAAVKGLGFAALTEMAFAKGIEGTLKSFSFAGCIMCGMHLISSYAYADTVGGMRSGYINYEAGVTWETTQNWYLLTYDNESVFYIIPLICVLAIYALEYNRKAAPAAVLLSAVSFISFATQQSVTAAVALAGVFLSIMLLACFGRRRLVFISGRMLAFAIVIALAIITLIVCGVSSGLFGQVAVLLGKDPTFSDRRWIWTRAIEVIKDNPIFGVGLEEQSTTYTRIGQTHCHNLILELLYTGGVACLIPYVVFSLASIPKQLEGNSTASALICLCGMLGCLLISSMDWYPTIPVPYILYSLVAHLGSDQCISQGKSTTYTPKHFAG